MIRLALVAAAVLAATGCAFERRSTELSCATSDECDPGRTCEDGWCVEVLGGGGDGAPGDPDGGVPVPPADAGPPADASVAPDVIAVCPPECTSCSLGTCVMNCAAGGSCATVPVVCPPGIPCKVECAGAGSCAAGVDCTAASSCRIECTNLDACDGPITCGAGVCRVECGGASSCGGGVDCSGSCMCDTFCTGSGACALPPVCPGAPQCDNGLDCTGIPGPCNSC